MSLDRAHLARADDLVLVEQEHGYPGCCDELVDLRLTGAQPGWRVPVGGGLPDPVGLVQDEHVEAVAVGVDETG